MTARPLDPWRQGRALAIGLCYLGGTLATVSYGEYAATRPAPAEQVEVEVEGDAKPLGQPSVARKNPTGVLAPSAPPPGSLTLRLFDAPLPGGVTMTQLGVEAQPASADTDAIPSPVEESGGEPAAVLATPTVVYDLKALARKAGQYVLGLRGRCNKAPGTPSCRVKLTLNGSDLATLSFSDSLSLQSRVIQSALLNPQGNALGLVSLGDSALELTHLTLMPLTPSIDLDVGTTSARPFLVDGFYDDESDGERSAAWSSGNRSVIALALDPEATNSYEVRITGHAIEGLAPLNVEARVNGKSIGSQKFGAGWGYYTYSVPPSVLQKGTNLLELSYPTSVRPAETEPGSKDQRQLAIRLEKIWVTPADGTKLVPN
ncbi:MAG: hypothetical protein KC492_29215 [Myxococcales bacterium]|nr:hypothetical protein [Myxococcales bacterium]